MTSLPLFTEAEAAPERMRTISTSGAKKYRLCPRAYFFAYELRRVPAYVDPSLRFGKLGHRGLEAWYGARMAGEVPESWLTAAIVATESESDPYDRAKAQALLVGYHDAWAGVAMDVVSVEAEFEAPLVNPATGCESKTWRFNGVIDTIVRMKGRTYVIEHKTSSEQLDRGSIFWERLALDSQVSNYLTGARVLGFEPEGVIYDVIRKPRLRPMLATPADERRITKAGKLDARQRENDETPDQYHGRILDELEAKRGTPDAYFVRGDVVRLPNEERDGAADLWATAHQIRDSRRLKLWPRSHGACFQFNRPCEYFAVCTGRADINDDTQYQPKEEAKKS